MQLAPLHGDCLQLDEVWALERAQGAARGRTEGADCVRAPATQQESRTRLYAPKRKRVAARSQADETWAINSSLEIVPPILNLHYW